MAGSRAHVTLYAGGSAARALEATARAVSARVSLHETRGAVERGVKHERWRIRVREVPDAKRQVEEFGDVRIGQEWCKGQHPMAPLLQANDPSLALRGSQQQ